MKILNSPLIKKTETCWLWNGRRDSAGYGRSSIYTGYCKIRKRGVPKTVGAHQKAYIEAFGAIPKGASVCHSCDVRNCVNPNHLYLGSMLKNMNDARDRKRFHNQKKTHCRRGHPYSGENLSIVVGKKGRPERRCKQCRRKSK